MALSYRMSWICILFGSFTSFADPPKKGYKSEADDNWWLPSEVPSNTGSSSDSAFTSYHAGGGRVQQRPVKGQQQPNHPRFYNSFMNFVHSNAPGLFSSNPPTKHSKPDKGNFLHAPQRVTQMQRPGSQESQLYPPIYVKKTQHNYQRGKVSFSKTRYSSQAFHSKDEASDEYMVPPWSVHGPQPPSHAWFSSDLSDETKDQPVGWVSYYKMRPY
ncbi:uncharacterized protein LOC124479125 [Hypomesus transpacificus]|uniref:uncharacterized protein LOC124479125 n=1 Tax=Hypomesus transpacificus TaxID=137520 RepID=UPI001F078407|nr:uncharacterized protein LOC124479125 [Hypomesus transpacificus]